MSTPPGKSGQARASCRSRLATCLLLLLFRLAHETVGQEAVASSERQFAAATPATVLAAAVKSAVPASNSLPQSAPSAGSHSDWEEDESAGQTPAAKPFQAASASSVPAGLEHSTSLPPLDARLAPGRIFDPRLLSSSSSGSRWYMIPNWLAGLWKETSETILEQINLRSGLVVSRPLVSKRRQSLVFGMQEDRDGNIWHRVNLPALRKFRMENRVQYKLEVGTTFPVLASDQAVTATRTIVVEVENDTNLIVETRQEEALWHLSPIPSQDIRCLGSMKSFDMNGTATSIYRVALKLQHSRPFLPQATAGGEDLRASLAEFLNSQGMNEVTSTKGR